MAERSCATHGDVEATFRCDGCGKLLCQDCIEEGHRLLFCRSCGERAMPLAIETPAAAHELRRTAKRDTPYGLRDALMYPFRGLGRFLYWGYVLVLCLFAFLATVPGLGCAVLLMRLLILILLPGLLFAIVRTTAEGETELPDWPDWSAGGERLWEWFGALLAFVVAILPTGIILYLSGCGFEELSEWRFLCSLGLLVGSILGAALWIPAFGAVAVEWNPWMALRIDLHVRALTSVGVDAWKTLGLLVALLVVRQALGLILLPIPLLGGFAQIMVATYTLLMGAHFIGLLFRRHAALLDAIYN